MTLLITLSIVSTTPLGLNTSNSVNRGRSTSNALQTICDQLTPVAATRRQETPMTNVSNGTFSNIQILVHYFIVTCLTMFEL